MKIAVRRISHAYKPFREKALKKELNRFRGSPLCLSLTPHPSPLTPSVQFPVELRYRFYVNYKNKVIIFDALIEKFVNANSYVSLHECKIVCKFHYAHKMSNEKWKRRGWISRLIKPNQNILYTYLRLCEKYS